MSQVDQELAKTLQSTPDFAPVERPARSASSGVQRSLGLLGALAVIALAIGALVLFSLKDAAVYAKSVDQLLASAASMQGRRVRVEGTLVHGSLLRRDKPCEYRFQIHKSESVLNVRYAQCVVPDTFRDRPETDVGVTAEGKLGADGVFEATQIMAKCPSKYEERARAEKSPASM